jgi:hypothetical protein
MTTTEFAYTIEPTPQRVRYIVEHRVDESLWAGFEQYMTAHLAEVGATGCFLCASLEKLAPGHYRLVWLLPDIASLEQFQSHHAPAMRADFALQFPDGVKSTRTHSALLATWLGPGHGHLV